MRKYQRKECKLKRFTQYFLSTASAAGLVFAFALPANAAYNDTGGKSCSASLYTAYTQSRSTGTVVHMQINKHGGEIKYKEFTNGSDVKTRLWSKGWKYVRDSSLTTTGSFSGGNSKNKIFCEI